MHSVKKPMKKRINKSSMGVNVSSKILLDTKVEPQIIMHTKAKICPIPVLFFILVYYIKKWWRIEKIYENIWSYVIVVEALVMALLICYSWFKEGDFMGGLCVLLLMMFCVGWILCVFFLSMLIPLLIIYNGIVGIVCFILYFVLRKKSVFTKYTEGYKHVLSTILKYGLIVYGSISLVFSIILAILSYC